MYRFLFCVTALLLAATVGAHGAATGAETTVVRIDTRDEALIQRLGQQFGHVVIDRDKGWLMLDSDDAGLAELTAQGVRWQVDKAATAALRETLQPIADLRSIPGFACYRTVEETHSAIDTLVVQYPALASSLDIGDSWRRTQNATQGYDLRVLKLTNAATGGVKPKLFAMTAIHAREYTTAELLTRYAEELLAGYGNNADATWLLDHFEFHFLLQSNPDGRKRAETGLSWRKNENQTACGGGNSAGVDLNRNYPVFWNYNNNGSSTTACNDTYRGPASSSEPETQAVVAYVRSLFPDTRPGNPEDVSTPASVDTQGLFMDIHSFSRLVLWAWGHATTPTGNADAMARLGMRLAWFNDYEPKQAVALYPTRGTTDDFAYGELGLPAYTIELGTAFFENCTSFQNSTLPLNLAAMRYAARTLHRPYQLPAGPDAFNLALHPSLLIPGETATVTARVDDTRYRNQQQTSSVPTPPFPRHVIASARAYVDQLPWQAGATGTAMSAVDGVFDTTAEDIRVQLSSTGLSPGRHLVYVQGSDAAGETGPPAAVFMDIRNANEIATLSGHVRSRANGSGIAGAHISIDTWSGNSDAGGAYSQRALPGSRQVQVQANGYLPITAQVDLVGGGTSQRDFSLDPPCELLADDAEQGNAQGWTVQSPWATTAVSGHSGQVWADSPTGNYGNAANTALTSPALTLASNAGLELRFEHRCVTEANYDYGRVEIQANGGAWTQVFQCSGNNAWRNETLALNVPANTNSLRLRFRLTSDNSQVADGWALDNIRVLGDSPGCRAPDDLIFGNGFQ